MLKSHGHDNITPVITAILQLEEEKKAQREELKVHLILLTAWGFEK